MNLVQYRKINLENYEELKYFISDLELQTKVIGPANLTILIYDCLNTEDENLSMQLWMMILRSLSNLFNSSNINGFKFFKSYLEIIMSIIKDRNKKILTFSFMKSLKKWSNMLLPELSTDSILAIVAIDHIIGEETNEIIEYLPLLKFVNLDKQKIMINAYKKYIKSISNYQ